MDEFERHLYLYYRNGLNPPPRLDMKFKPDSADPVQDNDFLHNAFGSNTARQHKEFKCCFECQDLRNPIPARKLYPNWKLYPLLKHI